MYLFFVVAGVYDGAIVFSFALGFLGLVVLEEAKESAKLQAVHVSRGLNITAPLWLAHTLAFISIALGFAVRSSPHRVARTLLTQASYGFF